MSRAPIAISEADVQVPRKLVSILFRMMRLFGDSGASTTAIVRSDAGSPVTTRRTKDFDPLAITDDGATKYAFEHRFGGPVRFWPVYWQPSYGWNPILEPDASSDGNTLVLKSWSAGTLTLRVEEAGA